MRILNEKSRFALWQLRLGKSLQEVAELAALAIELAVLGGVVSTKWIKGSSAGSKGHGKQGRPPKLNAVQEKALVAK